MEATKKLSDVSEGTYSDARFWLGDKSDRAERIQSLAGRLWRNLQPFRDELSMCERLYGGTPISGLTPTSYRRRSPAFSAQRLSLNVTKAVVDTFVSLVTDDRPKLSVLTNGGDWDLQQKAEQLERFHDGVTASATDGTMGEGSFFDLAEQLEYDACIAGTGFAYYYVDDTDPDDLQIGVERVTADEILVDDVSAKYGKPLYLLRIKWIDRRVLQERYPKLAVRLQSASNERFAEFGTSVPRDYDRLADLVVCVQAWKIGTKKLPGMYCYVAGDVMLDERPWKHRGFPIEPLYVERPRRGIWGASTCDQLAGIQREINVLAQKIQRTHHLLGAGHWLIEESSNVNTNHMDNQIGSMVRYRGTAPQFFPGGQVSADVYGQFDRLYQRAFEIRGISLQAAQGQKPAGLDSGKALLVHADITTKRFQPAFRQYQGFFIRSGRQFERIATEISERQPSFAVKGVGGGMMKAVKWANAQMKDIEYVLREYPTNALAADPEGKMQQVETMANAGWINPADAMRLLDFPDLLAFSEEQNAGYSAIMACITSILTDGVYKTPEPLMPLAEGIARAQAAYLVAWRKNCPKDRLALLLRWIAQAKYLLSLGTQPANGNGAPPPPPQATPNSDGAAPPPAHPPLPAAAP